MTTRILGVPSGISIPLPSMDQQRRIVATIDEAYALIDGLAAAVSTLSKLLDGPNAAITRGDFAKESMLATVFEHDLERGVATHRHPHSRASEPKR